MPGLGSLVVGWAGSMILDILKVEPLLQQGIAISDGAAFLETSTVWSFAKEHSTTIIIEDGSVVWVPDGYTATVLHLPTEKM